MPMGYIKNTTYFGDWLGEERPGIGQKIIPNNPIPEPGNEVILTTEEIDWIGEERPWYGNKIVNQPLIPISFSLTAATSDLGTYYPVQPAQIETIGFDFVVVCPSDYMFFQKDDIRFFGYQNLVSALRFVYGVDTDKITIGWDCDTIMSNGFGGGSNFDNHKTLINGFYWPSEGTYTIFYPSPSPGFSVTYTVVYNYPS